jgi:hypothetical protein
MSDGKASQLSAHDKIKILLSYGVNYASATTIWKICKTVLDLVNSIDDKNVIVDEPYINAVLYLVEKL